MKHKYVINLCLLRYFPGNDCKFADGLINVVPEVELSKEGETDSFLVKVSRTFIYCLGYKVF